MTGFDCLGADEVGFDYMALLKGASGALSGVAEGFGSGGSDKGKAEEVKRLEEARRKAEQSSSNWRLALIGIGGVAAVTIAILLGRRK